VRILVTISRSWSAWSTVRTVLAQLHDRYPDAVLVHGNAKDGDQTVAGMWRSLGGVDEPMDADWDMCDPENDVACRRPHRKRRRTSEEYCPTAGLRRNTDMVETAPELVLEFNRNNSRGATDCATKARDAGLRVVSYTQE
jgi:hypothetical protein